MLGARAPIQQPVKSLVGVSLKWWLVLLYTFAVSNTVSNRIDNRNQNNVNQKVESVVKNHLIYFLLL
jgi:hypothetical protein